MVVSTHADIINALNQLGYGPISSDATIVDHTVDIAQQDGVATAAIRQFQTDHHLSADATAGPITKSALTAALANAGDPVASAAITEDNSISNTAAMHLPATSSAPAMTVHVTTSPSGSASSSVKPFGTPASAHSTLSKATGAKPTVATPLHVSTAAMSTKMKATIAALFVGGAVAAKKFLGKRRVA